MEDSRRKLIAFPATALQGKDEAVKIPMPEEPLCRAVSEGGQAEMPSQARAALLFFVGDKRMCKCLVKYQQEHKSIAWSLVQH